jgi:threonine dehydrogenase-like Zn-dependent dehydrogenase
MRAVLIKDGKGPVENLYIGEAPDPALRDGEVLVKVRTHRSILSGSSSCSVLTCTIHCFSQVKAFGLNRMDIAQREGYYPPPPGASEILGVEFSGTIHTLGPNVTGWKVGDEVLGLAGGVCVLTISLCIWIVQEVALNTDQPIFHYYHVGCVCRVHRRAPNACRFQAGTSILRGRGWGDGGFLNRYVFCS